MLHLHQGLDAPVTGGEGEAPGEEARRGTEGDPRVTSKELKPQYGIKKKKNRN